MIIFDNLSMWLVAFFVVYFLFCVCACVCVCLGGGILYLHFGLGLLGPLEGRVTTNQYKVIITIHL